METRSNLVKPSKTFELLVQTKGNRRKVVKNFQIKE